MARYVDIDKYNEFLSTCGIRDYPDYPCVINCTECYFKCNDDNDDIEKLITENAIMKEILRDVCRQNECVTCPIDNTLCRIAEVLVPKNNDELGE